LAFQIVNSKLINFTSGPSRSKIALGAQMVDSLSQFCAAAARRPIDLSIANPAAFAG
jgi:hypothetical protein